VAQASSTYGPIWNEGFPERGNRKSTRFKLLAIAILQEFRRQQTFQWSIRKAPFGARERERERERGKFPRGPHARFTTEFLWIEPFRRKFVGF